jgi:opacity protein-like surface antigen
MRAEQRPGVLIAFAASAAASSERKASRASGAVSFSSSSGGYSPVGAGYPTYRTRKTRFLRTTFLATTFSISHVLRRVGTGNDRRRFREGARREAGVVAWEERAEFGGVERRVDLKVRREGKGHRRYLVRPG